MTHRGLLWGSLSALLLSLSAPAYSQDPPPPPAGDGVEELTRGPVHEAFGQPVAFNPTAGVVAPKAPPEPVEELPPDQRPEGDNIAWISGYWAWDDEATDFLWVSGLWRNIPPGRTWVPGYWGTTTEGNQWVSGYWSAEGTTEVEYLPPPPENLETGPVGDPPAVESVWVPGCWMWRDTRYLWRPGYYVTGNADWVWAPAHYEYTPAGYVFVDGYWDYPLATRGLLFAPVTFTRYRPGIQYIPRLVISTDYLSLALFSRPAYSHYYFGDYYANSYVTGGIYPWFSFHNSRRGYDPLFAHTDYVYSRRDPRWEANLRQTYFQRRDNEAFRPARTFRAQADVVRRRGDGGASLALAQPLVDVRGGAGSVNVVKVNQTNITNIRNNIKVVNQSRTERVNIEKQVVKESGPGGSTGAKGGKASATATARTAPIKVKVNANPTINVVASGKGGRAAARAPEVPTAPKATEAPPATGATRPKLPDPEDVLRPDFQRPGAKNREGAAKGKDPMPKAGTPGKKDDPTPVPMPRPKKDVDDDPPGKKNPPKVTPKKDRDDDPVRPPMPKPAPKKDRDDDPPPRPKKDRDDDPPARPKVTPMPPAKADPPPRPKADPPPRPKADPPAKADPPKADPPPKKGKDKDKDKD